MKKFFILLIAAFSIFSVIFMLGPRPDTKIVTSLDPSSIPSDPAKLESWLAQKEASVENLRDNAAKEIVWANPQNPSVTDISLVYLHGFSASKTETAPLAQEVAKTLGANLFLTRLAGHGSDGRAMAEATLSKWADDTIEAVTIGNIIGRKLVILSGSTGGTLATWAAAEPRVASKIDALVSISPNYAIHAASIDLMNMPWAETILPMAMGSERSFEPSNELHAAGWTYKYPIKAVFPMAALLKVVSKINYESIKLPHFFIYAPQDKVIVADAVEAVEQRWGGPTKVLQVTDSTDPHNHVIAGDALSPNTTQSIATEISAWINTLN